MYYGRTIARRRVGATRVRRAAAAIRIDLDPHVARRQRDLGNGLDRQFEGRRDAARDGRRMLGEGRAFVSDGCPLDRRRADHRHPGDGQDRRPAAHLCGRRHAGCHRCRGAGRRVGVHQPLRRTRHVDRTGALRCAAIDAARPAARRSQGDSPALARSDDRARRAAVRRHACLRPPPSGRDRSGDRGPDL